MQNDFGQYWGSQQNTTQNIKQIEETKHIFIDNRYRTSGSNVDFIVDFNNNQTQNTASFGALRNVTSVELKAIHGNFMNDEYIVIDIKELNNRVISNVPVVNQSFCIAYCCSDYQGKQYIKGYDFDTKQITFKPPLSLLSRLEIRFKRVDGTGNTNVFVDDPGIVTMLFEVITINNTIY